MSNQPIENEPVSAIVPAIESGETFEASLALAQPKKPTVKRTIREKKFANSIVVRRGNGDKVLVPLDGNDNKRANMLVVAMARDLVKTQMDLYKASSEPLRPKELADVVGAVKTLTEASEKAYGEVSPEGTGAAASPNLIAGMQAVGKGMMEGGMSAIMKELDALGKKRQTQVVAAKPIIEA
jgi:hypothetical protein